MSDKKKDYDEELYHALNDIFTDVVNYYALDNGDLDAAEALGAQLTHVYDVQRKTCEKLGMPNPLGELLACFVYEALEEGEGIGQTIGELLTVIAEENGMSEVDVAAAKSLLNNPDALQLKGTDAYDFLHKTLGADDLIEELRDATKKPTPPRTLN